MTAQNIDSPVLNAMQDFMAKYASESNALEQRIGVLETMHGISQENDDTDGESKVDIIHQGGFDEISSALKDAFIDTPVLVVQTIWAKGDDIVQGMRKTYYEFAGSIGDTVASWSSREIEIAGDAPQEVKDYYSTNVAQAANESKLKLEETDNGMYLATFGVDSTRGEIFVNGQGEVIDGQARIFFDKSFTDIIDHNVPIRVMITPTSYFQGSLYIADKTSYGFTVNEIHKIDTSVTFDWLAIARKKGFGNDSTEQNVEINNSNEITDDSIVESNNVDAQIIETSEPTIILDPTPVSTPIIEAETTPTSSPESEIITVSEPIIEAETTPKPSPEPEISITPSPEPEITPTPTIEPSSEPILESTPEPSPTVQPLAETVMPEPSPAEDL